jgi:beta-xylosidase
MPFHRPIWYIGPNIPHIIDTSGVKWVRRALWAPAVTEKDGKYYIFFGANDIQNNNEKGGIGVAVSDKPEGPFKDYLGKPLSTRSSTKPNLLISLFLSDDNGQYYMIYGGWGQCNIVKLKNDFTGVEPFDRWRNL